MYNYNVESNGNRINLCDTRRTNTYSHEIRLYEIP